MQDFLTYDNLQEYFQLPEDKNLTRNTRAKLYIHKCPKADFFCQSFTLPDFSLPPVDVSTSAIQNMNVPGDHFSMSQIAMTILIDEPYESYFELVRWLHYTVSHGEIEESYSNGVAIIYSSELEPILQIRLYYIYPISINALEFVASEEAIIALPVSFAFLDLEVEDLKTHEVIFKYKPDILHAHDLYDYAPPGSR